MARRRMTMHRAASVASLLALWGGGGAPSLLGSLWLTALHVWSTQGAGRLCLKGHCRGGARQGQRRKGLSGGRLSGRRDERRIDRGGGSEDGRGQWWRAAVRSAAAPSPTAPYAGQGVVSVSGARAETQQVILSHRRSGVCSSAPRFHFFAVRLRGRLSTVLSLIECISQGLSRACCNSVYT